MYNKFKYFVLTSATFLKNLVSASKPFISIWGDCDNSWVEDAFYNAGQSDGVSQTHTSHCRAMEEDFARLKLDPTFNKSSHIKLDRIYLARCSDVIPAPEYISDRFEQQLRSNPIHPQFEQQLRSDIPLTSIIGGAVLAVTAFTFCCKSKRR